MKRATLALIVSGVLSAGAALPAVAAINVDIDIAPPAPRVVEVPRERRGYVWAPGYWDWRGHKHVWVNGRYLKARHGYHYVPEHWDENHGRWHLQRGHWEH